MHVVWHKSIFMKCPKYFFFSAELIVKAVTDAVTPRFLISFNVIHLERLL